MVIRFARFRMDVRMPVRSGCENSGRDDTNNQPDAEGETEIRQWTVMEHEGRRNWGAMPENSVRVMVGGMIVIPIRCDHLGRGFDTGAFEINHSHSKVAD